MANATATIQDPLVSSVWSDDRNINHRLACGHTITLGLPLGRWAHASAKRRRCYKCGEIARAGQNPQSMTPWERLAYLEGKEEGRAIAKATGGAA